MSTKPKPKPKAKVPAQPATSPLKSVKVTSGSNQEHAKLSPSHFATNLKCPASLTMEHGLPNESSDAAAEGTVMHHVAECCLNNFLHNPDLKGGKDPADYVGMRPMASAANTHLKESKIVFTKDMAKLITPYVEYVKELKANSPDAYIFLEQRVELTQVLGLENVEYSYTDARTGEEHTGTGTGLPTFGTADLVALIPIGRVTDNAWTLEVDDLKTGRGKVYAEGVPGSRAGNMQLVGYAAGLYRKYTAEGYNIKAVRLGIFGPRMGFPNGCDFFDLHPVAMKTWANTYAPFAQSAVALLSKGKKHLTAFDFNPGESQCQWCRANKEGLCAAKNRAIMAELDDEQPKVITVQDSKPKPKPKLKAADGTKPKPKPKPKNASAPAGSSDGTEKTQGIELTPDEIAAAYAKLPALKEHIAFIEKAMNKLMFSGDGHADWKLVDVPGGNRVITSEEGIIAALKAARYKDDQIFTRKILSPAQLEKLTEEKPRVWKKLQEFIKKPDNKTAIAPIDDPRPAHKGATKDDLADE